MDSRRTFLISTGSAAFSRLAAGKTSANNRIRVAVLGVNGRGKDHIEGFQGLPDAEVAMLCDPDRQLLEQRAFQFKEIDAQSIPFEGETFDGVIANHMLYHVPDCPKAVAEIKRVLKPGGHVFVTTVGENHMKEMMNWYARVHVSRIWESFANPFTLENGLAQLEPYFPNVARSRYVDNLEITEIEPIMAYVRSCIRVSELSEAERENLQRDLERELSENGKILISKDSGLFEAIK